MSGTSTAAPPALNVLLECSICSRQTQPSRNLHVDQFHHLGRDKKPERLPLANATHTV